jgi:diguanylate cyclase (GGDEF)-like protein
MSQQRPAAARTTAVDTAAVDELVADHGHSQRRVARSVGEVHLLLGLLTLLYYIAEPKAVGNADAWFLAIATYGSAVIALRNFAGLLHRPKLRLAWEATAMTVFVTALILLRTGAPGPLLHLYLLPVIAVALALGTAATVLQVVLVVLAQLSVGVVAAGLAWFTLPHLITLFANLAPTLLVAFLTLALAADRRQAQQRVRHLTERDQITGLLSMSAFSEAVATAQGRALPYALLKIDVDGLKRINERFGHQAGDRALVAVADSIRRATREVDICGRFGGDEFLVALPGADSEAADVVLNRIRHHVYSATQDFDYAMRRLSVSIGVALYPGDGQEFRQLLQLADRAMEQDAQDKRKRAAKVGGLAPEHP